MKMIPRMILALSAALFATAAFAADEVTVTIRTLHAQMKYDTTEFDVKPGQKVKLVFQNDDDMPHNMCFFQPGTDAIGIANKQIENADAALKRDWIPEDKSLWLHSKSVQPKTAETLTFTAPEKPGVYPYVCTFPGHAAIMNGRMTVGEVGKRGPGLTDLKFKLYLGDWKKLPDFAALKPHREGDVPDNLVQLKLDDYKNQYGLVFTGKLDAPKDGEYFFLLASDDGGRISMDGKRVVEFDGIHPAGPIHEGKVKLTKGTHEFRLEYFQAAGQAELFAAWRGPGFIGTPLSKWIHPEWKSNAKPKKKNEDTGMPLVVAQEPVIYRNFITGAGNRGIGVGYPGNANIAWSAETMNLAIAWRGAFIDAAKHWNGRGGGAQPPLGFDAFRPTPLSQPFAVLAEGATWPTLEKDGRPAGYTWRGYELDAKRSPVFHYEWEGVKVSERYEVTNDALSGTTKLIRTLKLDGKIPAGALFRVASAAKITPTGADFFVEDGRAIPQIATDSKFIVNAEGAKLTGKDLTLPARAEIKVTYSMCVWPKVY